jgi:hypothetical protein
MDDKTRSVQAIVPEEKGGELALPSEMIHRGLELAIRIERKQVIQPVAPSPIASVSKGYLVRSYQAFMEWYRTPDDSLKLREPEKFVSKPPVYLWVSFDQEGIHISCVSKVEEPDLFEMEGNADRYRSLSAFNDANAFTIPVSSFGLFYTLMHPVKEEQIPPELMPLIHKAGLENIIFGMGPTGQPGYKGPVTKEANPYFDINRDCVQIVLIYLSMLKDTDKKRELVTKNPPVKLRFTVIDSAGENDPAATRELYHAMLDARNKISNNP